MENLLKGKPFFLVGHSDGASIALLYGAERAPLLKGIISEAAHVMVEPETIRGVYLAEQRFESKGAGGLTRYHGEKTEAIFKAWSQTWQSVWFRHWNITYALPSISCPVLVIQGEADQFATGKQVEHITAGLAQPTPQLISDCGHTPHLEEPELLTRMMADFINKHSS